MAENGSSDSIHNYLQGADIAKILSSEGPVAKCVLLRAGSSNDSKDTGTSDESPKKQSADMNENEQHDQQQAKVLVDLIDEIEVDTTPSKSMVAAVLGGSFTFLGQYDVEGTVLMVRKLDEDVEEILQNNDDASSLDATMITEHLQKLRLRDLRGKCRDREIDMAGLLEKGDLITALRDSIQRSADQLPPLNPHVLQPPLDGIAVRGDILIMRVAETNESLDNDSEETDVVVPSNDEFFLDYTKDEYVAFASRTDIVSTFDDEGDDSEEVAEYADDEEEDEDEDEVELDDEEDDETFTPADIAGELDDEEEKGAMLNFIMAQVLRKFRKDNGRGPDTRELLELRAEIAQGVGVEVASVDMHDTDWDRKAKRKKMVPIETQGENPVKSILTRKRSASDEELNDLEEPGAKKVKFAEPLDPPGAKEEKIKHSESSMDALL